MGKIPKDQLEMSRKPFAVMGTLDAIAGIMQIFSATYLPGPLLILLQQAAIPISMLISRYMLDATYNKYQYGGAVVVAAGIAVVLVPTMTSGGSPLWALMMIFSCVPMTLSSVYKEIALGERELDPMYLNGWIAIFQLAFTFVLILPAAMATDPPVYPQDLPSNLANGFK
jgi:drug/metabolite transporter (DMT)-like permease